MGNPNAAPERPDATSMHLEPGNSTLEVGGFRIEQFVTALSLTFDARTRRPKLTLELKPGIVDVTAPSVEIHGPFRDFLVAHGWRPPE